MIQPYQIVLDLWEANTDIDVETLKSHGVSGLIVRLNNMQGGHHMDAAFDANWNQAKQFDAQTIYFVYNPWVDGAANHAWLMAHLPNDFGNRRIMLDIEVRYPGYSAQVYSREVRRFVDLVKASHPVAIYTGGWFLPIVSSWPSDVEYWWGAYPNVLTACATWEQYKRALSNVSFNAFTRFSPGPTRLWQCTGDCPLLEGFGKHAVDVNVFPGELSDLIEWLGSGDNAQPVPTPVPSNTGTVAVYTLNFRAGGGIDQPIIGQLNNGTRVTIHERRSDGTGEWLRVSVDGWVAGRILDTKYVRGD